jgi:hypothetical protein
MTHKRKDIKRQVLGIALTLSVMAEINVSRNGANTEGRANKSFIN